MRMGVSDQIWVQHGWLWTKLPETMACMKVLFISTFKRFVYIIQRWLKQIIYHGEAEFDLYLICYF